VFVLVLAVPALLVVVLGYVVGYGLWSWLGGLVDSAAGTSLAPHAEVAGWVAGLLLLVVLVRVALVRWRRRRARPR
jgi:membrane associated rhomboid family serine protease